MRPLALATLAIAAFAAAISIGPQKANAVVYCAAGYYHAGCVVRPGVAVVHPGVLGVRGVARRTTRRMYRRSDMMLKHDITLLGHLDNGLGFYRFRYNDSEIVYVGVMAQEVQTIMPAAVVRGSDGYLWVSYDKLGIDFQTYDKWVASGAVVPAGEHIQH